MTNREQPADFEAWYEEQYESPQWSHCKNAMHDAWDAALASQGAPKAEAPKQVRITRNSLGSGDWVELHVDDALIHGGHDIPAHVWGEVIEALGHRIVFNDIEAFDDE